MQIFYSKGSGTDINVERIENLAVKKNVGGYGGKIEMILCLPRTVAYSEWVDGDEAHL